MFAVNVATNEITTDKRVPKMIELAHLGYKGVCVVTSERELQDARDRAFDETDDDARHILRSVNSAMRSAYENIEEIHATGGQEWDDFMDDGLLLAVYMERVCRIPVRFRELRLKQGHGKSATDGRLS